MREHRSGSSGTLSRRIAGYGSAALVAIAPLLVGGGPAFAQALTSALALAVVAAYLASTRGRLRLAPFGMMAAVAAAAVAVQLVPLPAPLLHFLSPKALELRQAAAVAPHTFLPITLDVPATVLELAKVLAGAGTLFLASAAARSNSGKRAVVLTLAFIGGGEAVLSAVHRTFGWHSILGLYSVQETSGSGVFGTFVNGNQASALLTLSCLVAMGLAAESSGLLRGAALASALASAATVAATGSRGGVLSLALGGFMLLTVLFGDRFGYGRAAALAGGLTVLGLVLSLWASTGLRSRLLAVDPSSLWNNQKVRGWSATLRLLMDFPLTGVGRGAFEAPAGAYRLNSESVRLQYPENVLLQMAADWGLLITGVLLALAVPPARRLLSGLARLTPSLKAVACALAAVLVHDLADLSLELSGVAIPFAGALGLLASSVDWRRRTEPAEVDRRWIIAFGGVWVVALAGCLWAVPHRQAAEGRSLAALLRSGATIPSDRLAAAIDRHPADYYLEVLASIDDMARDRSPARHLNRALSLNPADPVAHQMAGRWLARTGRPAQAALEYRLAHQAGLATDPQELLSAVGGAYLADSVPQVEDQLLSIAGFALNGGHVAAARRASARAVEVSPDREAALLARARLASRSTDRSFQAEAGQELLASAREPQSFITAADTLLASGDQAAADGAMATGLAAHPREPAVLIAAAQLHSRHGDLAGARALLARNVSMELTFKERIQVEETFADIAERMGDETGAEAARARARILARMRQ